jgi:L-threonylcarbamoyladenylate synthase
MDMSTNKETLPVYQCINRNQITSCASIVSSGGVIVFPTDTVYAIGCNPYNDKAVERVFEIKGRNLARPFPVLAANINDVERVVSLGKTGKKLAAMFWPGGLTIISKLVDSALSSKVTAGQMTIGVRIPNNACAIQLLEHCKYLVGTSANISGEKSARSVSEVVASSLRGFDAILDGGSTKDGQESTIIDLSSDIPQLIREGVISVSEIERAVSK